MPGLVVVGSTAGSVLRSAFDECSQVRRALTAVVVDRSCGLADFARERSVPVRIQGGATNRAFSDSLAEQLDELQPQLVAVFYTRLLEGRLLRDYGMRLVNFHPSLLPRHPGLGGFEKTLAAQDDRLGSTVHLIDRGVDTGPVLMQGSAVNPPAVAVEDRQHVLFRLQVHQFTLLCEALTDPRLARGLGLPELAVPRPSDDG